MTESGDHPPQHELWLTPRAVLTLGVGLALAVMLYWRVDGLDGPWYWRWGYSGLAFWINGPYILLAGAFVLLAQWLYSRRKIPTAVGLLLATLGVAALQLAQGTREADPAGFKRAARIFEGPASGSYLSSADKLLTDGHVKGLRWLANYPDLMANLGLHAKNKPPGPVISLIPVVRTWGAGKAGGLAGALGLVILAAASVPAVYWMLKAVLPDRSTAFHGATFFALTPSLVIWFPQWDQAYPLLTAGMVGCWLRALDTGKTRWAIGFGTILAIACFFSYSLLVLGLFLGAYAAMRAAYNWRPVALQSSIALGTLAALYVAIWACTGYDPIRTFRVALQHQGELAAWLNRPYPISAPFDLWDFVFGTGWVGFAVIGITAARGATGDATVRLALVLLQLVVTAATGLLAAETARVWLFMVPLVTIPVAEELSQWTPRERFVAHAALLIVVLAMAQNLHAL